MVPFVDKGRLSTDAERLALVRVMSQLEPLLNDLGIELHIETDWPADIWAGVMSAIESDKIRVCYDIGDRASHSFEISEDLGWLAPWIGSVHIKDRLCGGGTVALGTGDAALPHRLKCIVQSGYTGAYILQAAPATNTPPLEAAMRNLHYTSQLLAQ